MDINDKVNEYIMDIDKLGFDDKLTINTKQLSTLLGVSPSTIEKWRKESIGPEYMKIGDRVIYNKRKVCEWLCTSNIRTNY